MSIHHNGRGRSYARCDVAGCEENIIDLSLNVASAARVAVNFFSWTQTGQNLHECALHHTRPARRRVPRSNTWKRRAPK